ncbi:MAG TPA: isochorismatase family cysteine hydrolase [Candidatus Acidoferrales bacterium]|nr:isochorismatase family cysteine hydrolase [Candidatus Acidoferrales bacterium]
MLLWDVDTQVDFLIPGGRLYVPGAESIIPNLARLTQLARDERLPLISSTDAHQPGDPELKIYGQHCIAGTPGQAKVPETLLPKRLVVPNLTTELPSAKDFQQIVIEKQAFDVFTNPNVDKLLEQFGPQLQILLYGVVTEICVAAAARNLLRRGHKLTLVTDAVRALDETKAAQFTDELLRAGGQLTTTDDAMRQLSRSFS